MLCFSTAVFSQDTVYVKKGDVVIIEDTSVSLVITDDIAPYLPPNTTIDNKIYQMIFGVLPACPACPTPTGTPWSSFQRTYGRVKYQIRLFTIPGVTLYGFYTMTKIN